MKITREPRHRPDLKRRLASEEQKFDADESLAAIVYHLYSCGFPIVGTTCREMLHQPAEQDQSEFA